MSLKAFFKENVKSIGLVEYSPSDRFLDENGEPIKFKIRALSVKEENVLRDSCYITDKIGNTTFSNSKYDLAFAAASVVYPELNNAEFQDNYEAKSAEELLSVMLTAGEFGNLNRKIAEISGAKPFQKKVDEAKNS